MSDFVEKLIKVGIALTKTRELENFLEFILGARAGICADYGFRGFLITILISMPGLMTGAICPASG
jgi:hypothetical protein